MSRYYRDRFGAILHHNVDKALLRGGSARPRFGGGEIETPIEIYLAGRAVNEVGGEQLPIEEIAMEHSRAWLKSHLHAVDVDRAIRIHCLVRQGSADLVDVFKREGQTPLANDTSIGVGYAPLSPLEQTVLKIEQAITSQGLQGDRPAWGEDVKVMGFFNHDEVDLTVACALIDRHVADMGAYVDQKRALESEALTIASTLAPMSVRVVVNAADAPESGSIYLTVTGTSAEAGDDGQVGRGNRINGLITPNRPMSLEAAAGKNPVSHVGKLYNVAAHEIAQSVIAECAGIEAVECFLLSRIGTPITEPAHIDMRLETRDGRDPRDFAPEACAIAFEHLNRLPDMTERLLDGTIELF